jgi:uncharacterized protein involved in exopolysaccharide biosynthesis
MTAGNDSIASHMNASPQRKRAATKPLDLILRALRGRLIIAGLAASMLGLACAAMGYKFASPTFTASGAVRVAPVLPRILYGNEDNQQLPMYDTFLAAQATLLTSRPVLERATADPALTALGWPTGPAGVRDLDRVIQVVRGAPRSELIEVTATTGTPLSCTQAVNSVLDAFEATVADQQAQTLHKRQAALTEVIAQLNAEAAALDTELLNAAAEYGADNLDRVHLARVEEIERLDRKLRDLDNQIAESEARRQAEIAGQESDAEVKRLSVADHAMAQLLLRQSDREADLDNASVLYGPEHPRYQEASKALDTIRRSIQSRLEQIATLGKTGVLVEQGKGDEVALLRALRSNLIEMRSKVSTETISINRQRMQVNGLLGRQEAVRQRSKEANARLEQLAVEAQAQIPGRVSIAVRAMVPVSPSKDKRKSTAAAAGLLGSVLGILLVALPRVLRRRIQFRSDFDRYADVAPLLASFRGSSRGRSQVDRDALARLRVAIESSKRDGEGLPIAIAGVARRSGTTTIARDLGESLADAGWRVALVDATVGASSGSLTEQAHLPQARTLRDVLSGLLPLEAIAPLRANLGLLPSGFASDTAMPHQPWPALIGRLKCEFDFVLIDAGSCGTDGHAEFIAASAGRLLLVARCGVGTALFDRCVDQLLRFAPIALATTFIESTRSVTASSDDNNQRNAAHPATTVDTLRTGAPRPA